MATPADASIGTIPAVSEAESRTRPVFGDPDRVYLRKATRAAVVVTALFALVVTFADEPVALFAAFGSFAALVFADFGGPLDARLRAYGGLLLGGAVLVALGTACADNTLAAVVAMVVVGFGTTFLGALGGYFAAGATATILAFVLSVMSPGAEASLAARELGWILGVGVAGVAAVTLWPVHQRQRVRAAAVAALREVARVVEVPAATRSLDAMRATLARLDARAGVVYRPAGNIARERALVAVVIELRRVGALLDRITFADRSPAADDLPAYRALAAQVAATFAACATMLEDDTGPPPDLEAVERARQTHADALEAWAVTELEHDHARQVLDRYTSSFALRRLALLAATLAGEVAAAVRPDTSIAVQVRGAWNRARIALRAHADVRSVRFRNAVRAGVGLGIAVLVARTASLEHEFWVVLGSLSVLRSNAMGTGSTALHALIGALIGFGLASVVMLTVGGDATVLWILLPFVVFLAGYTPGAVNFVVGQASFTVFVVVLFNILVPEGWRTGLVRVQDVAIGAGISVVVGAVLWPRGARGVARRQFAQLLRAGSAFVGAAVASTVDGEPYDRARRAGVDAVDARERAVAAMEDVALERGGGHVDRGAWYSLLARGSSLIVVGDGVLRAAVPDAPTRGCETASRSIDSEARAVVQAVDDEAGRVERSGIDAGNDGTPFAVAVPTTVESCLSAHRHDSLAPAIALVRVYEWLALLAEPRP
jgi:uncharacterized membrane protein YccC